MVVVEINTSVNFRRGSGVDMTTQENASPRSGQPIPRRCAFVQEVASV